VIEVANYDRIASYYDLLAHIVFGNQLVAAQNHFLPDLDDPKRILVFGGGTGHMMVPLLQLYPDACIHYLESSAAMISKAKARIAPDSNSVSFTCGTEQELTDKANSYDLIITPFVLDIFKEKYLKSVFKLLFDALSSGGKWIQTDFYVDQSSPGWQKLMIWLMYKFFRVAARQQNQILPDFDTYFEKFPLRLLARKSFYHRMVRTHLYIKYQE
jgi:ubiquinone/menaquinone biosynthesis C-methylase UbiE